jgi:hypothetical protein
MRRGQWVLSDGVLTGSSKRLVHVDLTGRLGGVATQRATTRARGRWQRWA